MMRNARAAEISITNHFSSFASSLYTAPTGPLPALLQLFIALSVYSARIRITSSHLIVLSDADNRRKPKSALALAKATPKSKPSKETVCTYFLGFKRGGSRPVN